MEPDTDPKCVIHLIGTAGPIFVDSHSYDQIIEITNSPSAPRAFEVLSRDGRRETVTTAYVTLVAELVPDIPSDA